MSETETAPRIVALEGGTYYQHFGLRDPRTAPFLAGRAYLPHLADADLAGADTVLVTDRLRPDLLRANRDVLLAVAERGDTLVILGENAAHTWVPGVDYTFRPINFWWWLEGGDDGVRLAAPGHPAWAFFRPEDMHWHYHGFFTPPPGAVSLVDVEEGGVIVGSALYVDEVSTPGRLIVTTMDPVFHHGGNFMPASSTFLANLLRWLIHAPSTSRAMAGV